METDQETKIAEKILWAYNEGSPIATYRNEKAIEMAKYMHRRWKSYELRNKQKSMGQDARIFDLAKGLATTYTEGGYKMAGPLIEDYKWLSEQVAPILQ